VSGGFGEMVVMIGGKSYYVCCSGCREALLDDPDSFIKGGAGSNKEKSVQP
jgi:YHS domain-containing protein